MTNFLEDGVYLRELEGSGENLLRVDRPDGTLVYQYRHVFTGPTLLDQETGNAIPTFDFAGFAFATVAGAPYDRVERILESATTNLGVQLYGNRVVDVLYKLDSNETYYHQEYSYAGSGQGYIASERVSGSRLDSTFYDVRIDYYDPTARLTGQSYQDASGAVLMRSDYAYNEGQYRVNQPWAMVEADYIYANGSPEKYRHVYRLEDGTIWADIRHVDSTHDLVIGSAVTDLGFASRYDYVPGFWGPEKQEYRDADGDVVLTVDIQMGGAYAAGVRVEYGRTTYGSALDDEDYYKITDWRDASSNFKLGYRLYDMDDGSHLYEIKSALQYGVPNTRLGNGVTNANDIYRLFGADTLEFTGRFGTDTVYDFEPTNPGGGFARPPLNFSISQFADLTALRAASVVSGTDVVITNSFGDQVLLKDVIDGSMTINDVLTAQNTAFIPDYFA